MGPIQYKCIMCDMTHLIPRSNTFNKVCDCGNIIWRHSDKGEVLWNNTSALIKQEEQRKSFALKSKPVSTSSGESAFETLVPFFLKGFVILAVVLLVPYLWGNYVEGNSTTSPESKSSTDIIIKPVSAGKVTVYSGSCTVYKLTLINGNKKKYTPTAKGFGKVVLDRSTKKFTFIFNDKLVYTYTGYFSEIDNNQGGESYSLSGDWSAYRFTAERLFKVYNSYSGMGTELGYEYEIINYKTN